MPMLERPISKADWTRVRFDQIATQINDRVDNPAESGVERYVGLEHLDPDSLRIRRWGEPTDVESTKLRFQPGDIIFGKRRVYQRKVAVADFEGICSAHAMVLRAKPGAVLPDFLPFFMQSDLFMERALSISVGSLSPTINWKALAAEEFLLPPIQEQARFVEISVAVNDAIGHLRDVWSSHQIALSSATDDMIRSALSHAKEASQSKEKSHGGIAFISDVARVIDCKHRTPVFVEAGVPMVAPGDIKWGKLNLQNCKQISESDLTKFMDHLDVEDGDLIFSRNQSFGIAAYVLGQRKFALGQDTVAIKPRDVGWEYLYLAIKSTYVQKQIRRFSAGSTFGRINLGDIRKLSIPLPIHTLEARATSLLKSFSDCEDEVHARLNALIETRQMIISGFFSVPGGAE
jgi:hypothetical protein